MYRRLSAALGAALILLPVLVWSRGARPADQQAPAKLPTALGAIHPRLSPDGSTLAFSYQGENWTGPRAGGTMTRLTPSQGLDTEPAWSPDGRRVAFLRGTGVKVVRFPDGQDVPLPKAVSAGGTYAVGKLEFFADGKRLLGAFRVGESNRLAWFDLASGELTPLVPASSYFRFALSPDGEWIAHTSIPDQPGEQSGNDGSHTDVWKQPANGQGKAEKVCRFPARVHDLCWADGGSLVVAAELAQAHDDLWKVPLTDPLRGMVKLTSGQAYEDRPSVSRDGKWLAYTDNRSGPTTLVVRDMAGGEESAVRFDAMDYRRPTGTLRLTVKDLAGGKPTVARISLREDGGRFHAPPGSLHRSLRGRGQFYCDQAAELTVPAGTYRLSAYRGPEYKVAAREVVVKEGQTHEVAVELERWVHMAKDGWYSGELHIHANYGYGSWFNTPQTMRQQCVGEDLNVCNFMVANSDADYPQVYNQKPGLGFPIARLGAVVSLACGAVVSLGFCRYAGKGQGEVSLLRRLWDVLRPGDVLLADRLSANWATIFLLRDRGLELVSRLNKAHCKADFRRGRRLGTDDHVVCWAKPTSIRSLERKTYQSLPESITVRETRVRVPQPGFRTRSVVVVTTLLDPQQATKEDLAALYRARWHAELDLRSIKSAMQMRELRCKTPELVRKEVWAPRTILRTAG